MMRLEKFTLKDAKDICNWKYEEEYSIYNEPTWKEMLATGKKITLEEVRNKEYVKVVDENNNYIGYGRIRTVIDDYLVGFGMKPEYTGKGLGKEFVETVIKDLHGRLVLEVRESNKRAINCYKSVGFRICDRKYLEDDIKSEYVLIMVLDKK